jgi:cytochrome c oxidase subunit 3
MSKPQPALQYADHEHQAATAVIGMWLFLASEILFFSGLLLCYAVYRHQYPAGFADAVRRTNLMIGTINTAILLTSSLVLSLGVISNGRRLAMCCLGTAGLGVGFLVLKGVEYVLDWREHLVPGAAFAQSGLTEPGAELFYLFYYTATGLHAVHMAVGVALLLILAWRAARGAFSAGDRTAVVVGALYWSFVDIVWVTLYPLIYLVGRMT